jgi:hypothetical protein
VWGLVEVILGLFKDVFVDIFKDAYKTDGVETKVEYAEGQIDPVPTVDSELLAQYRGVWNDRDKGEK